MQENQEVNSCGFFKAMRTDAMLELIARSPNAFTLAAIIAFRARWKDGYNQHGLTVGEAFLGDFNNYGMSQKEYRTAKKILKTSGFAAFRRTNRGTVAKLIDKRLFDVSPKTKGEQKGNPGATNEQRTETKDPSIQNRTEQNVTGSPFREKQFERPSENEVFSFMMTCCPWVEKRIVQTWAYKWIEKMDNQEWMDGAFDPVRNWKPLAQAWAQKCASYEQTGHTRYGNPVSPPSNGDD